MCLWGTAVQELFSNQYNSWKACDSVPCAALITGLFLKGGVTARLVEPYLLGGFPRSLYLWLFIFNIFIWPLLSTVLTFRISLMPASLLLFGTLSPIEWPLWQYSRGPSCSFLKRLGTLESCPRSPCSMGFASVFCTLEDSSYFQTERQVLWKCLTHLNPKELEELDCPQCLNVLHKISNEFYTWQILMLAAV